LSLRFRLFLDTSTMSCPNEEINQLKPKNFQALFLPKPKTYQVLFQPKPKNYYQNNSFLQHELEEDFALGAELYPKAKVTRT
jgi:hypothetical protein